MIFIGNLCDRLDERDLSVLKIEMPHGQRRAELICDIEKRLRKVKHCVSRPGTGADNCLRWTGLDIHKEIIVACVRCVSAPEHHEVQSTMTGLLALSHWLAVHGCSYVGMVTGSQCDTFSRAPSNLC